MFDHEQYSTHPYRHIDSTSQTAFFPYIYPSYRSELNVISDISESKTEDFICQWIDPDTNRMCNRRFSHMQDIGKNNIDIPSILIGSFQ